MIMKTSIGTGAAPFDVVCIPAFRDNYIWVLRHEGKAVVVDPGDAVPVAAYLLQENLQLAAILVTHHHADHQGGVAELTRQHGAVDVYGPSAESITGLTRPLQGGEVLSIPAIGTEITVLPVPGHTLGHLAYQAGLRLFCGDTLFGAGCGRLFEGSPAQMASSLALLASMPDETEVFCAHEYTEMNLRFARAVEPGNEAVVARQIAAAATRARGESTVPSSMALEKATNPFLRCREPAVVEAARLRGCADDDPVAVFATIRAWRNEF